MSMSSMKVIGVIRLALQGMLVVVVGLGLGACGSKQPFKAPQPDAKPVQKAQPAEETAEQNVAPVSPVTTEKSDDTATLDRCEPSFADYPLKGLTLGPGERVVLLSDLDGDHKAEVVSVGKSATSGVIRVHKQNAEGNYVLLSQVSSLVDTQGINRPVSGTEIKVFAGFFSKKSKDNRVKDLVVTLRDANTQQMHILQWDLTASAYASTAVYSAIKSSDASKNIREDIFPVSSDGNNVFRPVLAGNFLGGNYDGVLFHGVNMANAACLGEKTAEDCGDAVANLFLIQFDRDGGTSKFSTPYLVADGVKRNYRLAAGNLLLTESGDGLDLLAQRQCQTYLEVPGDNGCDEPGMTALGGAGGARGYINTSTVSGSSTKFEMIPAVDDFENFNVTGGNFVPTYEKDTPKKVYRLELGDADRDGLDDLFAVFQGNPGSQETGKGADLCVRYNLGDGFSDTCNLTKKPIAFAAEPFVADLNGDGTSDVILQDAQGGLSALSLSCQDGAAEVEEGGSGGVSEDSKF